MIVVVQGCKVAGSFGLCGCGTLASLGRVLWLRRLIFEEIRCAAGVPGRQYLLVVETRWPWRANKVR